MPLMRKLIGVSLPLIPKAIVGRVARRYVAGDSVATAIEAARRLNAEGNSATLALLGEEVTEEAATRVAVAAHQELLAALHGAEVDAGISLKLTLLGLEIDENLCRENLAAVLEAARPGQTFVRIDMEDHTCTEATIRLFNEGLARYSRLGIVFQAYLRRALGDIEKLPPGAAVRLCKGIYIEPPHVAFQDYESVRLNFIQCLERLFERGARVGIATHDEYLITAALGLIQKLAVPKDRYEFQMLLGVTEGQRRQLLSEGHAVRVYVPYGRDWYAYSVRRLRENPKIAVYVMKALLAGRSLPGNK